MFATQKPESGRARVFVPSPCLSAECQVGVGVLARQGDVLQAVQRVCTLRGIDEVAIVFVVPEKLECRGGPLFARASAGSALSSMPLIVRYRGLLACRSVLGEHEAWFTQYNR